MLKSAPAVKKRAGSLEVAQPLIATSDATPMSAPASLPRPVQRAFSEANDLTTDGKTPAKNTCGTDDAIARHTHRVATMPVMLELEEEDGVDATEGVIDTATSSNAFGADTTSRLPAPAIMDEMRKALTHDNIAFSVCDDQVRHIYSLTHPQSVGPHKLMCTRSRQGIACLSIISIPHIQSLQIRRARAAVAAHPQRTPSSGRWKCVCCPTSVRCAIA